jgi:hypothetical protein
MWDTRHLTTLQASTAYYGDSFTSPPPSNRALVLLGFQVFIGILAQLLGFFRLLAVAINVASQCRRKNTKVEHYCCIKIIFSYIGQR